MGSAQQKYPNTKKLPKIPKLPLSLPPHHLLHPITFLTLTFFTLPPPLFSFLISNPTTTLFTHHHPSRSSLNGGSRYPRNRHRNPRPRSRIYRRIQLVPPAHRHLLATCAIDHQGHGFSDDLIAHIPDINPIVNDCIAFFDEFRSRFDPSLHSFLYSESLSGGIALLITLHCRDSPKNISSAN
ncbi:hypothetical protein AHAS_Ahas13G0077200 [Arachis hypogaea]